MSSRKRILDRPVETEGFGKRREYLLRVCDDAVMLFGGMTYAHYEDDLMAQYALSKVMEEVGVHLTPGNGHVDEALSEVSRFARNELAHSVWGVRHGGGMESLFQHPSRAFADRSEPCAAGAASARSTARQGLFPLARYRATLAA